MRTLLSLIFSTLLAAPLFAQAYTWTNFAGPAGRPVWDGPLSEAGFDHLAGIAVGADGSVYISDRDAGTIRKITPGGMVTTLAGLAYSRGWVDRAGADARFRMPTGLVAVPDGSVLVADWSEGWDDAVRKIMPAGAVSTLPIPVADPRGLSLDATGNVYIADAGAHAIRKVTPQGEASTLAGHLYEAGAVDGTGAEARFRYPIGVAAHPDGNVYVADTYNHTIRRVSPEGVVTTLAGVAGVPGNLDGTGSGALFGFPNAIAVSAVGTLYVVSASTIREVTTSGNVTTLAGAMESGSADGTGSTARFWYPSGLAVAPNGNVYVADRANQAIRIMTPGGEVTTLTGLAGPWGGLVGTGAVDGVGSEARFNDPSGVGAASDGTVYVADRENHTIRKITSGGIVTTFAGLAGMGGSADGSGGDARFYHPWRLTVDADGNLYVSESSRLRKITPSAEVTTLAGGTPGSADGIGSAAQFDGPSGLAVDAEGNVFVADTGNHTIRKVTQAGVVSTFAGMADQVGSADGTGSGARFSYPEGIAIDSNGIIFVGDGLNRTIRRITPAGEVTTVAGAAGIPGDTDGTGSEARFDFPSGLGFDPLGNLVISERHRGTIRRMTPAGVVTTIGGVAGVVGSIDGTGAFGLFGEPSAIGVDGTGNVYVCDRTTHRIIRGSPAIEEAATIDSPFGLVGEMRTLGSGATTASEWNWKIIRIPAGSIATLSSPTAHNPTFTPDVGDRFVFRLTAGGGADLSITEVGLKAVLYPPVKGDLNGDGTADLFWRRSDGLNAFWLLDGATVLGGGHIPAMDSAWSLGGTGDFDGDATTDLLWWNEDTSELQVRYMNGIHESGVAPLPSGLGGAWEVRGVGDLDGNGKADLVWRNAGTLENRAWLMNGTVVADTGPLPPVNDPTWEIAGSADFDGEGHADLVWRNAATGDVALWFMDGFTRTGMAYVGRAPMSWKVSAAGDFDGDGRGDIVWHNTGGDVALWFLDGGAVVGGAYVGRVADTQWSVAGPK